MLVKLAAVCNVSLHIWYNWNAKRYVICNLGSISPIFYKQILWVHIPKAQDIYFAKFLVSFGKFFISSRIEIRGPKLGYFSGFLIRQVRSGLVGLL